MSETLQVRELPTGCVVNVRVIPRARQTMITGCREGVLLVRVAAPPVEGAANAALLSHLADVLGIPARRVRLARGATSRHKQVAIEGVTAAHLRARFAPRRSAAL